MSFISKYSQIPHKKSLKGIIRNQVLSLLSLKQNLKKSTITPRVHFLYIHHVFDDELEAFGILLLWLKRNYEVVSYSKAVELAKQGGPEKAYITLSSDDGFKNNLKAAELCSKHGISMCFFINPALIDEQNHAIIKKHCAYRLHLPAIEMLTSKDLKQIIELNQEIGHHTMNHERVSDLDKSKIQKDTSEGFSFIKKLGVEKVHFAFPYGRESDYSEEFHQDYIDAFESVSSAVRGYHSQALPSNGVIHRDHLVLSWPMAHIKYFIKSAKPVSGDWYDA